MRPRDRPLGANPRSIPKRIRNALVRPDNRTVGLGAVRGIVDKAGAWYSYKGDKIGQGKDNVRNFLIENPEMSDEIETQIRAELLPKKGKTTVSEEIEETEEA